MKRGKFITFEGGDGVGKSTQIARLADRLRGCGVECIVTREPGGTPFAERIRTIILEGNLPSHSPLAEALLFASARVDHVEHLIGPGLEAGKWVLCDRFADSTRAYQGAAGGGDEAKLLQLEGVTHGSCAPDLTLILDLDPEVGRTRISERNHGSALVQDPFEARALEFQQRLREGFLQIAADEPDRCVVIDASLDADGVATAIWQVVEPRFAAELS